MPSLDTSAVHTEYLGWEVEAVSSILATTFLALCSTADSADIPDSLLSASALFLTAVTLYVDWNSMHRKFDKTSYKCRYCFTFTAIGIAFCARIMLGEEGRMHRTRHSGHTDGCSEHWDSPFNFSLRRDVLSQKL